MSWSSEPSSDVRPLTGRTLAVVLAVATALMVGLGWVTSGVAVSVSRRSSFSPDLLFALVGLLGLVTMAVCVAVAVVTRVPGLATAVWIVAWIVGGGLSRLGGTSGLGGTRIAYPVLLALCLLGADAVVLTRRGRPLPVWTAAVAGLTAALLICVVREVYFQLTIGDDAELFHVDHVVTVDQVVSSCVVLALGGLLGLVVGRVLRPRSAQFAEVG